MDFLVCECIELILPHLGSHHVNRLKRTSKDIGEAMERFEETYWSGSRITQVYRSATLRDGRILLCWIGKGYVESFTMRPLVDAKAILKSMWQLREEREREKLSLFVDCVPFPDIITTGIPCYLFKTRALKEAGNDNFGTAELYAWPVYIACRQHSYRFCGRCALSERFFCRTAWPMLKQ